jgi:D-beta-D-heptose 7-phosphate kinase / D-beta-D-heptose 1-phosphate adenosyltransferase
VGNSDYARLQRVDLAHRQILVAGEAVLDRYVLGETSRISPEAPIPVLHVRSYEERPGNAAFVCANLAALGAAPSLMSVVGADHAGRRLRKMLAASGVKTSALVEDPSRPTISKERLMGSVQSEGRATQQLLRVDHEDTRPLTERVETRLRQRLDAELDRVDGVLVCDIGKGILTPGLLRAIIDGARQRGKAVVIDPRRADDYSIYRKATALTPNRYETERATGMSLKTRESWDLAAQRLIETYELARCLITLDRDGMFVAERRGSGVHVKTTSREVYDVTGAGDVVLAVFGLFLIGGCGLVKTATLANFGAGVEVSKQGATVISRTELSAALLQSSQGSSRKLMPMGQLLGELQRHRESGRRICFAYGRFFPFRARHVEFFEFARAQGDLLVVGTQRDARCSRPAPARVDHTRIIAGVAAVDFVLPMDGLDVGDLIGSIRPDVLVGGGKGTAETRRVAEFIRGYGGTLVSAQSLSSRNSNSGVDWQ